MSISPFGVFLSLGVLLGVFLVWRLARAWDMDEEKVLDLTLLTIAGSLILARVVFVIENWPIFSQNLLSILVFYKNPGFSFWGGVLGGLLNIYIFSRKQHSFLQFADIAAVGFFAGLFFASVGCFFGGCNIGIQSNSFFAVNMPGVLGKRFPLQLLEAAAFLYALSKLWGKATHFHQRGKILSLALIYFGTVKLFTAPLRAQGEPALYLISLIFGIYIFYKVTKRRLISDLKTLTVFIYELITDSLTRQKALAGIKKYWYNQSIKLTWNLRSIKKFLRRANVRFSFKNNQQY